MFQKRSQVLGLISEIELTMPPLKGIIHGVGVLDDGILLKQTWKRFEKVLQPKVEGAWNLHNCYC